jgi:hypothetical protein
VFSLLISDIFRAVLLFLLTYFQKNHVKTL